MPRPAVKSPLRTATPPLEIVEPLLPEAEADERQLLCRIEYYLDPEPTQPTGWKLFEARMGALIKDIDEGYWATIVFDSLTYLELAARKYDQYVTNRKAKDGRQWYGASTSAIEENVMMRFGAMRANVIVIAHTTTDRDGQGATRLYRPDAPGKMPHKLPAGFSEVYRSFTARDADGNLVYWVQTESDNDYIAATRIHAPAFAYANYGSIWENTRYETMPVADRPVIHVLDYGEPGSGKSTFAASFAAAGPMLVCMFDPYGKDIPYLELGEISPRMMNGQIPYVDVYAPAA